MMTEQIPFRFRWPHYLLAVLVYLTLLLAWAPASLLSWALPHLTQQTVKLDQTEGSIWHGHAASARLHVATGPELQLGRLSWQFKLLDLFGGRLGYRLELAGTDIDATGTLRAGAKGVELRDVRAELPAGWLERLLPDLALWQPGGQLLLETRQLAISRTGQVDGQATLRWLNAVSGRVRPQLGSYRADIEGTEDRFGLKLTTESGPLFLQGIGKWSFRQGMVFNGTVRAAPESRAELDGLLSLIGPAQPDGSRAFLIAR